MDRARTIGILAACAAMASAGELAGDQIRARMDGRKPRFWRRNKDGELTIMAPGVTVIPALFIAFRLKRFRPLVAFAISTLLTVAVAYRIGKPQSE